MSKLPGIAFIGCGFIAHAHASALHGLIQHDLVQARLVSACDIDVKRAEHFRDQFGFVEATANVAQALDNPDVSIVYICTPTRDHAALLDRAAARNHAVFCEKPLAHTHTQAEAMLATVKRTRIPAQTGLVLRYSPVYTEMRRLLLEDTGPT
ncbi:MAG TPA: Gfo/Idh/MocA family oxidoreductase, partial [Candidatus Xenobia bacterium]